MNIVHRPPSHGSPTDEFRCDPPDEAAARAAALTENGPELFAADARNQFEKTNPGVHQAQRDYAHALERREEASRAADDVKGQLSRTAPKHVVTILDKATRAAISTCLKAMLYFSVAFIGLFMGNQVGANYVVKSGLDLYADNPLGATLFMGVPFLFAFALKLFELRLPHDRAQRRYANVIFGSGTVCFIVWSAMVAVTFAPRTAGDTSWLTGAGGEWERLKASLMLFSHLIVDVTCGYIIFTGAEMLLHAGHRRECRANPLYEALTERLAELREEVAFWDRVAGEKEDFVRRFEAAAQHAEAAARLACQSAALRHAQEREAAIGAAKVKFLQG